MKYCVIILNYNTSNDAITAFQTILENAISLDFIVCIVDNNSSPYEKKILQRTKYDGLEFLYLDENKGYANGNNQGIRYMLSKYNPVHIVIMNPDVLIIKKGTIDSLISKLETCNEKICGIQPLVWTPRIDKSPNAQINIRKVYDYLDCLIESSRFLKYVYKKRASDAVYNSLMPYVEPVEFEVPSGAFFIIKTKDFLDVHLFDDRTFLFYEEIILGFKLKKLDRKFILDPEEIVQHEQGASVGSTTKRVSSFAVKHTSDSMTLYLSDYLKVGLFRTRVVKVFYLFDFKLKCIYYSFTDLINNTRTFFKRLFKISDL